MIYSQHRKTNATSHSSCRRLLPFGNRLAGFATDADGNPDLPRGKEVIVQTDCARRRLDKCGVYQTEDQRNIAASGDHLKPSQEGASHGDKKPRKVDPTNPSLRRTASRPILAPEPWGQLSSKGGSARPENAPQGVKAASPADGQGLQRSLKINPLIW